MSVASYFLVTLVRVVKSLGGLIVTRYWRKRRLRLAK